MFRRGGTRWTLAYPASGTIIATMSDAAVEEMLDLARRLATEAVALTRSGHGNNDIRLKPDGSVVTDVDHAIQAHILRAIADAYPAHAILAEETRVELPAHPDPGLAKYCWVVDPLDGTRNYVSAFPCFSTSLAVLDEGRPVAAVVLEHNLQALYAAAVGRGATLNDAPIRAARLPQGSDMLVGIPSSKDRLTVNVLRSWAGKRGLICRNLGSTALHLGLVAAGALAAAFCKRSKIWDVAAGALLVSEAGARITDLSGADLVPFDLTADPGADVPFLAAASEAHEQLLASLKDAVG